MFLSRICFSSWWIVICMLQAGIPTTFYEASDTPGRKYYHGKNSGRKRWTRWISPSHLIHYVLIFHVQIYKDWILLWIASLSLVVIFGPEDNGSQPYSPRAKASAATVPRRNPTIKISRATRVQEKWNASLDREINDINELRHLDEFLGNQVRVDVYISPSSSFCELWCAFLVVIPFESVW